MLDILWQQLAADSNQIRKEYETQKLVLINNAECGKPANYQRLFLLHFSDNLVINNK